MDEGEFFVGEFGMVFGFVVYWELLEKDEDINGVGDDEGGVLVLVGDDEGDVDGGENDVDVSVGVEDVGCEVVFFFGELFGDGFDCGWEVCGFVDVEKVVCLSYVGDGMNEVV